MSVRITGGMYRGRRLRSVLGTGLRPTSDRVRGAIFSILGAEAVEGVRVLDLYAGTGALGIEALSRGAAWADFVELNARVARRLRENLTSLELSDRCRVYQARVETAVKSVPGPYGLVFADPPYDAAPWTTLMNRLSEGNLVVEGGLVVAEHRYGTALAGGFNTLALVSTRRYGDTSLTIYRNGASGG